MKALQLLSHWIKANKVMLTNAASLIGTTGVTAVLGFAYWGVAARRFSPESIGIAYASVSMMALLGSFCILGLGTLLITELPRQPGQEGSLISTALILVGVVGGVVGVLFALVAPYISPQFSPLRASVMDVLIFGLGVSQTAITLVLDQALIGLLRGGVQLWRNTLFAIGKLALLFAISVWISRVTAMSIYATWTIGGVLSLVALALFTLCKKSWRSRNYMPQWSLLKKLGMPALQHHLLNLALQTPTLVLPVVVTALLSGKMNAWFSISWMIVNVVFLVPSALTTVLHAMNAAQPATLAQKARSTMGLAFLTAVVANALLLFGTTQILGLFGKNYAMESAWSLRLLALAAFPLVIKVHYISICRIQDRITQAMASMIPGGVLELVAAAVGAHFGGLSGLCLAWTLAICCESLFMLKTVYNAVFSKQIVHPVSEQDYVETEDLWRLETLIMPAMPTMGQVHTGMQMAWLADVATQTNIKAISKADLENRKSILAGQRLALPSKPAVGNINNRGLKPKQLQQYASEHNDNVAYVPETPIPTEMFERDASSLVEIKR